MSFMMTSPSIWTVAMLLSFSVFFLDPRSDILLQQSPLEKPSVDKNFSVAHSVQQHYPTVKAQHCVYNVIQCCGSGMFIPDPDFCPSLIPDL
jgi:hypothetical protein